MLFGIHFGLTCRFSFASKRKTAKKWKAQRGYGRRANNKEKKKSNCRIEYKSSGWINDTKYKIFLFSFKLLLLNSNVSSQRLSVCARLSLSVGFLGQFFHSLSLLSRPFVEQHKKRERNSMRKRTYKFTIDFYC